MKKLGREEAVMDHNKKPWYAFLLSRIPQNRPLPVSAEAETESNAEEEAPPAKGIVDVPFLLITAALVLFGCVMIYSASYVFAQKHHDESTYFIARHLLFLFLSVGFTFFVVKFCTPLFWRDFAYIFYGISVFLLILVELVVHLGIHFLILGLFVMRLVELFLTRLKSALLLKILVLLLKILVPHLPEAGLLRWLTGLRLKKVLPVILQACHMRQGL